MKDPCRIGWEYPNPTDVTPPEEETKQSEQEGEDDDVVEVVQTRAPPTSTVITRSKKKGEFSGIVLTQKEANVFTDDIHYAFNALNLPVEPSTAC